MESWVETRWARPFYLAFVFCLALVMLKAIKLYLRRQRLLRDLHRFPAPPTHWFFGHQKFFQENEMEKLEELVKKYPCAFPRWVGPFQAFFCIYDPDYAKTFLSRTDPKSQCLHRLLIPCGGKGLFNLDGPKWFQHRCLLTSRFHFNILKPYSEVMAHSAYTMLDNWEKLCITQDTTVNVFEHINLMVLDILMKCAFSKETNCQINGMNDPYVKATFELGKIIFYRLYGFWYHYDLIFNFSPAGHRSQELSQVLHQYIDGYVLVYSMDSQVSFQLVEQLKKEIDKCKDKKEVTIMVLSNKCDLQEQQHVDPAVAQHWAKSEKIWSYSWAMDCSVIYLTFIDFAVTLVTENYYSTLEKIIHDRKKSLKDERKQDYTHKRKYQDFLDIFLSAQAENGDSFSDTDLWAEINMFMLAGHETTAGGISWLLYCLALNPEHQQRCREEIRGILGNGSSITWDHLDEMRYTTMCIKEALRMIPPVPSISRELSKPITFPDGRSLPAGMTVVLSIWGLHHNPATWENPKVFDPFRFSPENSDQRHSHAFLPFSAGPRNCIGQQFAMIALKVAVALILLRFKVTPDPTRPPILSPQMVLKSKNGIHLCLKKLS